MAQNNMRKMFTEQQIQNLAKQVGTKLYYHRVEFDNNEDIYLLFISTKSNYDENDIEKFLLDVYHDKSIIHMTFYNVDGIDEILFNAIQTGTYVFVGISVDSKAILEDSLSDTITAFSHQVTPLN